MSCRTRSDCRLCGSSALRTVLSLPPTPLANEYPCTPVQPGDQEEFPLTVAACAACGHVQLEEVVAPERLFRDYLYVSGTSPVFVEHFRRYANDLVLRFGVEASDLVVEIGSNDGTMLRNFAERGMRVLGVDPAMDIAARATDSGIPTWPEFFDQKIADQIVESNGKAKLVVANNVFAHADDLQGIALAVKSMLREDGVFVFEVGYVVDVLKKTLVDNVYHEHVSFHAVEPLVRFFRRLGMSLIDARRVNTHGGSIRVTASPKSGLAFNLSAASLVAEERELGLGRDPTSSFDALRLRVDDHALELRGIIDAVRAAGGTVAGYGAPAKATTLLRAFGLHHGALDYVVDDSPLKQGRYLPGTNVPILPSAAIGDMRPDLIVVLAWNFAEPILAKLAPYRASGGTCVVPLPAVRVVR